MSNKEFAILILISLLILYVLSTKKLRPYLIDLLKSVVPLFKQPACKLLLGYQIICIGIISIVLYKENLDFWIIKDYLLLVLFSIVPTIAKLHKISSSSTIKKNIFKSFTLMGILTFITNQYNFSIIAEVLLVSILIILVLCQVIAEHQGEKNVKLFFDIILIILSILIMTHSILGLFTNLNKSNYISILIAYLSEFISWLINIPLIIAWQYIGQYDVMGNFMNYPKTSISIWNNFIKLMFKKFINIHLRINFNIINNIQLGGLGKRCYLITVNTNYKEKEVNKIISLFISESAPKSLYNKYGVDKTIPFKIRIIDEENRNTIKSWITPNMEDEYMKMISDWDYTHTTK